ncbi:ECF RNA polymerase sigma factor SigW [compost metagenome]
MLALPVKYKTVIHLYYYEDYPVQEISKILKISESAVKMRLKRGRQLLKLELEGAEPE